MNLIDEAVGDIVSNYSQDIISIDGFAQFNDKYVEGLCWVLQSPRGNIGREYNPGVAV